MSHSRKRHPVTGNTCAESEKAWKRLAHRAYRAAVRQALTAGRELPELREVSSTWTAPKDGKQWAREATEEAKRK